MNNMNNRVAHGDVENVKLIAPYLMVWSMVLNLHPERQTL